MLRGLIILKDKNPSLMLDGDLAKVLDRDLYQQKAQPLTANERIGAATYYQWMPDLDSIVGSDRLRTLLIMNLKKKNQSTTTEETNTKKGKKPEKKRLLINLPREEKENKTWPITCKKRPINKIHSKKTLSI
jgi:hypothetical protein